MNLRIVWGCDPSRQFEYAWILKLFERLSTSSVEFWNDSHKLVVDKSFDGTVLVESGLLYLEKYQSVESVNLLLSQRKKRLDYFKNDKILLIVHLSDEEGFDGDSFYPMLSPGTVVWRNFYYQRFSNLPIKIHSFPIGPRDLFLSQIQEIPSFLSFHPKYPWSFMGTLWSSGSRNFAVSLFLRSLPEGYFFGGKRFGEGIPLVHYRAILLQSAFCLAPEGDRHLDTFRLWEILSCGSIPLIVDLNGTAKYLLPPNYPEPIFLSWKSALSYSSQMLLSPASIVKSRQRIFKWWLSSILELQSKINDSF